jgi:hypothetical protein
LSHRLHITFLITLVATALLVPAAPAGAVPPTTVYHNLKNDYRDLACLAGRVPSGKVQTSQCVDDYTDQYWLLQPTRLAGYYTLQNRISGLCLTMPHGENRAAMGSCEGNASYDWWALDPTSLGDTFMLRNYSTQQCLVALHPNATATQFKCTFDYHDQWWHFVQR